MKKIIIIIGIFALILPNFSNVARAVRITNTTEVSAIIEKIDDNKVKAKIKDVLAKYPSGTSFSNSKNWATEANEKITTSAKVGTATQCYGFALYVYASLFGLHGGGVKLNYTNDDQSNKKLEGEKTISYQSFIDNGIKSGAHIRTTDNFSSLTDKNDGGHSMILLCYDSNYIFFYHGNSDGSGGISVTRYTWNDFNNNQLGGRTTPRRIKYIAVPKSEYYEESTTPPSNPNNLTSQRSVYNSSEDIFLTWDAALGATNYWIYMWKDGEQIYHSNLGNVTEFHSLPTSVGKYTFIVRAGNSYGYSDGVAYTFVVTDDIPEKVTNIRTNKSEYTPGEEITFYWDSAYGAQEYWVYLWKDGTQIDYCNVGLKTNYTTSLIGSGQYTFIVRPGNINGYNEGSAWYSFEVKSPYFEINSNRTVYKSSESIDFTWNLVDGATNYWVYMWKDGIQLYSVDMGNNTGFSSAPTSPGQYTIIVRALANNSEYAANSYSFIVTDSIPQSVSNMWSDKEEYVPYDSITFSWDEAYGTQDYWVYLWKDGIQLSYDCVGNRTSYTTTLIDSGKYTLVIRPSNVNGFNEGSVSHTIKAGLYDVIYNENITDEIYSKQTKFFNEHLYLNEEIPKLDGYVFVYWNTKSDGTGVSYNPGDVYTENKSITLYAQWEIADPCTKSTVTKTGTTFNITSTVYNIDETATVIVAGYKNGRFVTMDCVPYNQEEIATALMGDIDTIKVMVWNSLSVLMPLCESEIITSDEFITQ